MAASLSRSQYVKEQCMEFWGGKTANKGKIIDCDWKYASYELLQLLPYYNWYSIHRPLHLNWVMVVGDGGGGRGWGGVRNPSKFFFIPFICLSFIWNLLCSIWWQVKLATSSWLITDRMVPLRCFLHVSDVFWQQCGGWHLYRSQRYYTWHFVIRSFSLRWPLSNQERYISPILAFIGKN